MYADILVEIGSIEKTFTYKVPSNFDVLAGMRVLVPFGTRKLEGFILKIYDEGSFDYEVKDIIDIIDDHPVINDEMLELGKYISKRSLSSLISVYQTMLPSALKAKSSRKFNKKYLTYISYVNSDNIKTVKQKEVLDYIRDKKEVLKSSISSKSILKYLLSNGNVCEIKKEVYRLNDDVLIIGKNMILLWNKEVLLRIFHLINLCHIYFMVLREAGKL